MEGCCCNGITEEEAPQVLETSPSLKVFPGHAYPLGVSELESGINFAVFSQHATSVILCLLLPERWLCFRIWNCCLCSGVRRIWCLMIKVDWVTVSSAAVLVVAELGLVKQMCWGCCSCGCVLQLCCASTVLLLCCGDCYCAGDMLLT